MFARFPEREPSPFSPEPASEIDFEGDRVAWVLYEASAAVIEFFGPMMWAALIMFTAAKCLYYTGRSRPG